MSAPNPENQISQKNLTRFWLMQLFIIIAHVIIYSSLVWVYYNYVSPVISLPFLIMTITYGIFVFLTQNTTTNNQPESYEQVCAELLKEREKTELIQEELDRSQRMASLGTFAAGIAHEVRNPLGTIRIKTESLTTKPRDENYLKEYKESVLKNIDRTIEIVKDMLNLARSNANNKTTVNLNNTIQSTIEPFITDKIKITTDLSSRVPLIEGNQSELCEVFANLIQNSVEFMSNGGEIKIKTHQRPDKTIIVEVTDNGPGIPKDTLEKIFDPFFSTRHDGVGLGLSIVYRIIKEHKGKIKVKSEEGKGTTFTLQFKAN